MIFSIAFAILFILALEILLLGLSSHSKTSKWFSIVPAIFWMYFLPGVFSKFGFLKTPEPLSLFSSHWLLPLALILMIAPADVKRLLQMGRMSFVTLWMVYITMIIAGVLAFVVFRKFLYSRSGEAFAALAATWTGGTVNMLAVKEIVNLSDSHFSALVITDAFLSYGWMAILMMVFRWANRFDTWTESQATERVEENGELHSAWFGYRDYFWIVGAIFLVWISRSLAVLMPVSPQFPLKVWTLLFASVFGVMAASAGWHKMLQSRFSQMAGPWLLYFVLMAIRAQADFLPDGKDFVIIAAGFVWLFFHGLMMVLYAKTFRVRLGVIAIASQSAVGGVISAPVVAALYDPTLVSVAVLMGIFGNLVGTYLGLLLGQIVRLIGI